MRIAKLALLVVLLGGLAGPAAAVPIQWEVAAGGNEHWYDAVLVGDPQISWVDADAAATAAGGYLATLTSAAENAFVYDLVDDNTDFWWLDTANNGIGPWLGGIQTECDPVESSCGWDWVTGEPWGYTNWAAGEPNDWAGSVEDALSFHAKGALMGPQWNDRGRLSPSEAKGYVIEYVPEPATLLLLMGGLALLPRRRRDRQR
jgi:hypothetical protein